MITGSAGVRGVMQVFFLILGMVALILVMATVVRRISAFYRSRYNFSIWSGVIVIVLSYALSGYCYARYEKISLPIIAVSIVLLLITGILNIRLAGVGLGLLAFFVEAVLAVFFALIVFLALLLWIVRLFRGRGNNSRERRTSGRLRPDIALLLRFFMP